MSIKKIIEAILDKKMSIAEELIKMELMERASKAIEEGKETVVRDGKKVRMFKRKEGKRVDQKTGVEKAMSGSEKRKLSVSAKIGAKKRKAKQTSANRKREKSMKLK